MSGSSAEQVRDVIVGRSAWVAGRMEIVDEAMIVVVSGVQTAV